MTTPKASGQALVDRLRADIAALRQVPEQIEIGDPWLLGRWASLIVPVMEDAANALDAISTASPAPACASCADLLAALKTLARDYELLLGDGLTDDTAPPILKDAHAAIARAEAQA